VPSSYRHLGWRQGDRHETRRVARSDQKRLQQLPPTSRRAACRKQRNATASASRSWPWSMTPRPVVRTPADIGCRGSGQHCRVDPRTYPGVGSRRSSRCRHPIERCRAGHRCVKRPRGCSCNCGRPTYHSADDLSMPVWRHSQVGVPGHPIPPANSASRFAVSSSGPSRSPVEMPSAYRETPSDADTRPASKGVWI